MATNQHSHIKADQKKKAMQSEARNQEIYQMRLKGMPLYEISQVVKLTPARVSQIVSSVLDQVRESNLELGKRIFDLELARLDKLSLALESGVMQGDTNAVNSYLRIMERRAKMVGYDVGRDTQTVEHTIKAYIGFEGPDEWDKVNGVKENG